MTSITGDLSELFGSIQGEGLYAGERHIFVRTAGCGLICAYCDTRTSREIPEWCSVYGQDMTLLPNPIDVATVLEEIAHLRLYWAPVEAVSITGGEPLEQGDFVAALAAGLRDQHLKTYLDTNGIEVEGLSRAISQVDVVAADIKLPSSCSGVHWDAHRQFLQVAHGAGVEIFVKVVIDTNTLDDEIKQAVDIIAGIDHRMPLVLQPESGTLFGNKGSAGDLMQRVIGYQVMAAQRLQTVRVIPQIHRILRVR